MVEYSEDALIEQPAIRLFKEGLNWQTVNAYEETFGPGGTLGRENRGEVVLLSRLRPALEKLNSKLPQIALDLAMTEIIRDRSTLPLVAANQQVYKLIKEGVKVTFRDKKGHQRTETVRVLQWEHPQENDFLLVSQLWVTGNIYTKRPDLIGFVNGLPLVFIELKASHKKLESAYRDNLRDYKDTIPHLLWYNALILLSNGTATRLGSLSGKWEHFKEWKRINSEGEKGVISLETALRGTCDKARLLDIVENFILFTEGKDGLKKLVPMNHQFLGVNNAFGAVGNLGQNQGKLGVFWHTQGSGKSYSMIYFAQKVRRKLTGNWTFLVVTDRTDLDRQIYNNFAGTGAVTEPEASARAQSIEHLKRMLAEEDHRYIFTTIQKFGTQAGAPHPQLSDRSDIIVITDEAHRSQYDTLALNLRSALPNAAFLGFTGTPLMAGEERTKQVFGDYVSIYNFKQSVEDHATVPLYYENRIPELQLANENLNPELETVLERAELDSTEEEQLARQFPHEYDLITRDGRLEKVAEDLVLHFMGRGFPGKAIVVSIDKATTLKMFDKVKKHWGIQRALLEAELETCDPLLKPDIEAKIAFMRETDMAVVVSSGQNEIADMRELGLEIEPHRLRMLREDLDEKFKDASDPFRIVFVCAMWMTGFDVPSCSTIYLDKPMRNHTLMQTIARANRVFGEKVNGLIVDYIGIFKDLKSALAIYGSASGGGLQPGEMPVEAKSALVNDLRTAIEAARSFLISIGSDLKKIIAAKDEFARLALLDETVDFVLAYDETKAQFLTLAAKVEQLFQAILPDVAAGQFSLERKTIQVLAEKVRNNQSQDVTNLSAVMAEVNRVLDSSIQVKNQYVIKGPAGGHVLDLGQVDFDALKKLFDASRKHIEVDRLRGKLNAQLQAMLRRNKSRLDYAAKFEQLIADYNAGGQDVDTFFVELVSFARSLSAEEQRGISENLSEEELAIFDLLTRPNIQLTKPEQAQVKKIAQELLDTLRAERLVLDWRKQQKTCASVRVAIFDALEQLPEQYNKDLYDQKCEQVYQHVYESYFGAGQSIYSVAR
ncbi:MAG: type I restriction endonuclease subunit R [Chloroflexi bacterium]|nr:type I restriction endonuclease subunit R [Chloroflexota bacterium]